MACPYLLPHPACALPPPQPSLPNSIYPTVIFLTSALLGLRVPFRCLCALSSQKSRLCPRLHGDHRAARSMLGDSTIPTPCGFPFRLLESLHACCTQPLCSATPELCPPIPPCALNCVPQLCPTPVLSHRFHACILQLPFDQPVCRNPTFFLRLVRDMAICGHRLLCARNPGVPPRQVSCIRSDPKSAVGNTVAQLCSLYT